MYTARELLNDILHIGLGFALAYLFVPTAKWWIISLFVLAFAAVREHIQLLRGHKQRGFHLYTDCIGFLIGALLFVAVRKHMHMFNST